MMAWDKSSGIGVKGVERKEIYNLGSVRVQGKKSCGYVIDTTLMFDCLQLQLDSY